MTKTILPVSVVMPLYNDERYVAQALKSLVAGATSPAEIIVVDNGSTDRSAEVVEQLGLPQLDLIRNATNVGATRARNQALDRASQPLISWLDSDDRLSPDGLAEAVGQLKRTDSDIALFRMVKTGPDGHTSLFTLDPPDAPITGHEALALTLGEWRINAGGVYDREIFARARASFYPHGFSDDELLTRLCLAESRRVTGCNGIYYYRENAKPYNFGKVVGQTVTNLRSVALAARHLGAAHEGTRAMRDVVVRNLAGLRVRAAKGEGSRVEVRRLLNELKALQVPFGPGNRVAHAMALVVRLAT